MNAWLSAMVGMAAGWGIINLAAFSSGCENPFQTRTPEPPTRSQGTWLLPHSPEIIFANLRNAIAERNVVNYERCFADSVKSRRQFSFIPEATVANEKPEVFSAWGLREERNYFSRLLNSLPEDSALGLILRPDSLRDVIERDSVISWQHYELIVRHSQASVPGKVSGEGQFWLSRDQFGDWSIYRWQDFASDNPSTWSTLKAAFWR
jgi:hypothetical protein